MAKRGTSSARPLVDHGEIRQWAEERGGKPTCVRGTAGNDDVGMLRIDFPGYSGAGSLEEIDWNDWFEKFDERNLALLVQDETAGGQLSNFNKLVNRKAEAPPARRTRGGGSQGRGRQMSTGSARRRSASTAGRSSTQARSARRRGTAAKAGSGRTNGRAISAGRAGATGRSQVRGKRANSSARGTSRKKAA
jgi:hypothetical protein